MENLAEENENRNIFILTLLLPRKKSSFCHVPCRLSEMNVFSIGLTTSIGLVKVVCRKLSWRFDCVMSRHTWLAPDWSPQAAKAEDGQWLSFQHREGKAVRILHPPPGCWSLLSSEVTALSLRLDKKALGCAAQCCCHHTQFWHCPVWRHHHQMIMITSFKISN